MSDFYLVNHTQRIYMGIELQLLYNVSVGSTVLKAGAVEICRLGCQ